MHASTLDMEWLNSSADRIERTLQRLSLPARIDGGDVGSESVCFHLVPLDGLNGNHVAQAAQEIAKAVGVAEVQVSVQSAGLTIDVPLKQERTLRLLPLIGALAELEPLTTVVGMSDQGRPLMLDLKQQDSWHLWIEGPAASGKSELLRTLVISLALGSRPSHLKLLGIDVSGHELGIIEALPHALTRLATTARRAFEMINWLEKEIERRLRKGIQQPSIVLVVDDLAWMDMRPSRGLTGSFRRALSQAARAGVHVVATSRPDRSSPIRRTLSTSGATKAASMARGDQDVGWFEFQSARGSHRRARIAWLSAADLQIAVARASRRTPLGVHSLPPFTREKLQ